MSAKERKRKSAKERKKVLCIKVANNQVWNNQGWELQRKEHSLSELMRSILAIS